MSSPTSSRPRKARAVTGERRTTSGAKVASEGGRVARQHGGAQRRGQVALGEVEHGACAGSHAPARRLHAGAVSRRRGRRRARTRRGCCPRTRPTGSPGGRRGAARSRRPRRARRPSAARSWGRRRRRPSPRTEVGLSTASRTLTGRPGTVLHGVRHELGDDEAQVGEQVVRHAIAEPPRHGVARRRGRAPVGAEGQLDAHLRPGCRPPGRGASPAGAGLARPAPSRAASGGRRRPSSRSGHLLTLAVLGRRVACSAGRGRRAGPSATLSRAAWMALIWVSTSM